LVLSGTLREFILADVFQLLTQQKITGKLLLNNNADEGAIIFKDGAIVCAYKDTEKFENKLENYLLDLKKIRIADCKTLFSSYKDDIAGLTREVISLSFLSESEMSTLAEVTVEDITCSLFLWNKGSYRFSSIRSVDRFIPVNISIPIENIVMEAMRRVDEWNRMQENINDDLIFVNIEKSPHISNHDLKIDPIADPVGYISLKINGTSPVKELILSTPLTHYKIYESLNTLILSQKIAPLSDKISKSVQAALEKKNQTKNTGIAPLVISSFITVAFVLFVLVFSLGLFKGVIFSRTTVNEFIARTESPRAVTQEKLLIAELLLQSQQRYDAAQSIDSLLKLKMINKQDRWIFNSGNKMGLK
jgi:hypothetical protein